MNTDRIKRLIGEHSAEIVRLQARVNETFANRDSSPQNWSEWQHAAIEFYSRYMTLSFPGGLEGAYERIVSVDLEAMEAAICFLEVRPYFFRSGYMFKDILRKCNRAPLTPTQTARLVSVKERLAEWKRNNEPLAKSHHEDGDLAP
jgi:hypothetical protein